MTTICNVTADRLCKFTLASVLGFGLSACGSSSGEDNNGGNPTGGGDSGATYIELSNTTATDVSALRFVGLTQTGALSRGNAGAFAHNQNEISSGDFAGDINSGRTVINLTGGGRVLLTNPAGTEYLRVFQTEGTGSSLFGVVGQETATSDLPTGGTSIYRGTITLAVADGSSVQAMNGSAVVTADWSGANTVQSSFDGFRDSSTGGNVTGSITINGANMSGSTFSGGTLTTTGSVFGVSGSAVLTGTSGQFFGPAADEVGGTLVIDDTGSGTRAIVGVYSAD